MDRAEAQPGSCGDDTLNVLDESICVLNGAASAVGSSEVLGGSDLIFMWLCQRNLGCPEQRV